MWLAASSLGLYLTWKKMLYRPFAEWKDGDQIPSPSIPSGLVRERNQLQSILQRSGAALEQDGLMHIQLLFCVTFGLHERTLNRLKNSQLNLTARSSK